MSIRDILESLARGTETGMRTYLTLEDLQDQRERKDRDEAREERRLGLDETRIANQTLLQALEGGFRPAEAGAREATVRGMASLPMDPSSAGAAIAGAFAERSARLPSIEAGGRTLQYQPDVANREAIERETAKTSALTAIERAAAETERRRRHEFYQPHVESGQITGLQRDAVIDGANPAILDDSYLAAIRGEEARRTRQTPNAGTTRTGGGAQSAATQLAALKALQTSYQKQRDALVNRRGRVLPGKEAQYESLTAKLNKVESDIAKIGQTAEAVEGTDPVLDEIMSRYELEP